MSTGTFSAVQNATGAVLLGANQGVTITTVLTGGHAFSIDLETSVSLQSWKKISSYTADQTATIFTNNSSTPMYARLRCTVLDVADGDTIAWTFTETTGETNQIISDPVTGLPQIILTDQGITFPKNVTRTGQQYVYGITGAKVGAAAGWVVNAAANTFLATMAASQTAGTLIVPIDNLKPGWIITAFNLLGNLVSAGNAATIDADLRKQTVAAAGPTDASITTMTQLSVTANTAMSVSNTNKGSLSYTVLVGDTLYMKITSTTGASCTQTFQGIALTVTEN